MRFGIDSEMTIGSVTQEMDTAGSNITESNNALTDKYNTYLEDNKKLRETWEGSTAGIFETYSERMKSALAAAMRTTIVWSEDIVQFNNGSKTINQNADMNAGGN